MDSPISGGFLASVGNHADEPFGVVAPVDSVALARACSSCLQHRRELDKVVSSWSMHEPTVYMVAPCCFLYGHWFAVEAATCCGEQQLRQRVARIVQDVLITTQALDGS